MSETTPSTTTATGRASTKAKVEKEPRHQQTLVAVEADFSGPTPEDCRGAETSDLGASSISSILQREPSALLQRRTSSTQHLSASPFSSPTPIPFSGKLFTHIPTHSSRPPMLQPKLTVGAAHDAFEEEADQVAEQITRLPIQNLTGAVETDAPSTDRSHGQLASGKMDLPAKPAAPLITPLVHRATTQRKEDNTAEAEDEEEETQTTELVQRLVEDDTQIQPKRISAAESFETGVDFEKRLGATRDRGRPLPDEIRTFMEPRFQVDFSGVRVHDDHEAGELNRAVSARAFTLGQDIYLGEGQTNLNSDSGKRLLAHELTHVVQQGHANQLRRSPEDEEQPDSLKTETPAPEPAQPDAIAEDSPQTDNKEATHLASQEETEQAVPTARTPGATAEATPSPAPSGPATQAFTPKEATTSGTPGASDKAPSSPQEDTAFQAVTGQVKQVTAQEKTHAPAKVESAHAQAAAVPPANEVTSKAQDQHVQQLEQQKPGEFNAAAFKAALLARIQDIAPKTLKEADEFKGSNKLKSVKESAKTEVADGKKQATGPLEENAQKEPDPSGIEPKRVNPLKEPQVGPPPTAVGAEKAAPKPKGQSEVEAPLQQGSQSLDQQMAAADVTEEQLAESNEPEFEAALIAKRQAQTSALESPQAYRKQETQIVAGAQNQAQTSAATQLDAMHGERDSVLNQVTGLQGETKSSDEDARATVANAIAPIYEKTKQDVEVILESLDTSVSEMFDAGAEKARKRFEDYVDQRMKAYKKKRYSGLFGWAKWLKDKLAGMPSEVNVFYEEGRKLYIQVMDGVLDGIAAHVAARLNEAKARIAQGRQEIQAYVAQLPEDLQQIGAEAAQEMQGKFDELEQSLSDKQTELIDDLAQKYQDNLKEIDARIEELKAANAGLIAKAINFIKNVILTIVSLAAMLLKILAKAAAAVPKIILNPINFLKNLIKGVKQGLHNFVANIGTHLGKGLMAWLTNTIGSSGLQLPENLDLKGIFSLVLQTLGLTWQNIRERAVNILGEKAVNYLEKGFQIFQVLKTEGLSGLWEFIKDKIGDLKTMVFEAIKDMVSSKIVKAGMRLLAAVLAGPAGGFIKAIETIVNIVKWFLTNGKRLMALIDAILDSILAIASGSVEAAAKKIEESLAGTIPLVLSFLADLVGIGDLSGEIRKIITKVRQPINKAIDWVLKEAKKFAKKAAHKLGIVKDKDLTKIDKAQEEGRDVMHKHFVKGGKEDDAYADEEAVKTQAGPELEGIRGKYGLTELKPVIGKKDRWEVKGKIQRLPLETVVRFLGLEGLADLIKILGGNADKVLKALRRDFGGFVSNLSSGVGQGFNNFVGYIGNFQNVIKELLAWLTGGKSARLGTWDLQGVFNLTMEIVGLTWTTLRQKAVNALGSKAVGALETSFDLFQIARGPEGIGGLWTHIQTQVSELKTTVMEGIKDLIIVQAVKAGIDLLVKTLSGPLGTIIQAGQTIYRFLSTFVSNAQRIGNLLNTMMEAVVAVADGQVGSVAEKVGSGLKQALQLTVTFIAGLVGLKDLPQRVGAIINKGKDIISKALDWVVDKAKIYAQKIGLGVKGQTGDADENDPDVQAGLKTLYAKEESLAVDGGISQEEAGQIAKETQSKHPIFKSITVVDGGKTWDYNYTIQRALARGKRPKTLEELCITEMPINAAKYAGRSFEFKDPNLAKKYKLTFTQLGFPDFSPYAKAIVKIKMNGNYLYGEPDGDFGNANVKAGYDRNQRHPSHTWHHHEDRTTMLLVPSDLHAVVKHSGGCWAIARLGTLNTK
ncbi:hypothetical protein TFLX_03604 [Thermoflexales bacterium]|nr:hypothetical protein TFLX_03604 [Thermoflexales bacterium]